MILFSFFSSNGSTSAGGGNGSAGGGEGVGGDSGAHIDEEEWDNIDPLVDNGEPGVKVRALYDYEAAEEDELDFKAGNSIKILFVKFIYSEKATKFCKISILLLTGTRTKISWRFRKFFWPPQNI